MNHFTHLHLHSEFSLLDGAISLDGLIKRAKDLDFKALAITDHGNVFGAVKFFQKCKKAGIKPILGMEAYFTDDVRIKKADEKYNHLLILVQDMQGYRNLCKLISYSYQEGFYFKPRIDHAILEKYSQGLIVTSACLGGQIPQLLLNNNKDAAHQKLEWFLNTFGPERFYLEVQPEDQADQRTVNNQLYELSKQYNVPLLATGDCHYLTPEDREAHEIMLSIQTHSKIDDPDRYTFGECRVPVRPTQEMLSIFHEHQDAVWNSGVIADRCNFDFETGKLFFPQFEVPKEHTTDSYFTHLCYIGLERLIKAEIIDASLIDLYKTRLQFEIDLIIKMGFVGYFLVVSDFIQWAYRQEIPVGPGRGSAAGSLVAWSLQITNIDPIKYNLLFERFLNPERISMPDIDIDFCIEGRERVIEYVCQKYGHDNVCYIITFGTMMAKGVVKDVARVLGLPFEDANTLTSYIPDQLKITLKEAIEQEPRIKTLIDSNEKVKKIFDIALRLEGLTRHASKHAAGIVISPYPVDEVLPLYIPPKTTDLVSQYAMTELETLGFLKMDLLGLKNLTLIARALKAIQKNHSITINIDKIPLDDAKTFELLSRGATSGVFQLESDGLKEVLRKLKADKFEDIIAVNALYRPGPLGSGMVDDYIERRHGRQKIPYIFDELKPILQETYGVIVYQEQVMKIASAIAGYTLGESDILRRAMGKKKAEVMLEQGALFVERAKQRGFDGKKSKELFDLMAYFAGYGFNKSHSAAYALIAYQTAYLKTHYPAEFMACLISLETSHPDKMSFYLDEAKSLGITLLMPNINTSSIDFCAQNNEILFGLKGIKNVGDTALANIIAEREKNGPFFDLLDFCVRVDLRTANKRVIEHLIFSGTFDIFPGNRAQKFHELQSIMDSAAAYKKDRSTGQMGLFGAISSSPDAQKQVHTFEPRAEWSDKELLEKEKDVLGFYVSTHPLDSFLPQTKRIFHQSIQQITQTNKNADPTQETTVTCIGFVKSRREIVTKKGDRMCFLAIEDATDSAEIIIFPKLFASINQLLSTHTIFLFKGTIDGAQQNSCKIKANICIPLDQLDTYLPGVASARITLPESFDPEIIKTIQSHCPTGKTELIFEFFENKRKLILQVKKKIACTPELLTLLESNNATIKLFW